MSVDFDFNWPINSDIEYFGGISSSICIWSGHACPSISSTSLNLLISSINISIMSLLNLLYMISLLYFGTITIWYLHLYDVCDKLFVSFIDKSPLILLFLSCQAKFIVSLEAFYFQRSKLDSFTTRITRGIFLQ